MEKERSYNKMMSPQQQIKYEFTNQEVVAFRIGGWGGGFLIICLVGYVIKNYPINDQDIRRVLVL